MDDSKKIRQLRDFEHRLSELLSDQQRQHGVQVEQLMELAGDMYRVRIGALSGCGNHH